jgi:hypothetical protein
MGPCSSIESLRWRQLFQQLTLGNTVTAHLGRERQGPATGTIGWRTARCQIGDNGFVELTLLSRKGFKGREGEEGHADEERNDMSASSLSRSPHPEIRLGGKGSSTRLFPKADSIAVVEFSYRLRLVLANASQRRQCLLELSSGEFGTGSRIGEEATMTDTHEGQCLCGAVHIEASGAPAAWGIATARHAGPGRLGQSTR